MRRPSQAASCTQASLSKSAQDGEEQAKPLCRLVGRKTGGSTRLEQAAELTTQRHRVLKPVSADLTEVDALTGATITSTAVTNVVNNSYFYVTEVLSAE